MFLRVSQYFENSLPSDHWHSALHSRMTIKVPGIREPLISASTRKLLDEIRRFRHFKRYYFELDYDWKRLEYLFDVYRRSQEQLRSDIFRKTFFNWTSGKDVGHCGETSYAAIPWYWP